MTETTRSVPDAINRYARVLELITANYAACQEEAEQIIARGDPDTITSVKLRFLRRDAEQLHKELCALHDDAEVSAWLAVCAMNAANRCAYEQTGDVAYLWRSRYRVDVINAPIHAWIDDAFAEMAARVVAVYDKGGDVAALAAAFGLTTPHTPTDS